VWQRRDQPCCQLGNAAHLQPYAAHCSTAGVPGRAESAARGPRSTSSVVQGAWERGQKVAVHGLVYSPANGSVKARPGRRPAPVRVFQLTVHPGRVGIPTLCMGGTGVCFVQEPGVVQSHRPSLFGNLPPGASPSKCSSIAWVCKIQAGHMRWAEALHYGAGTCMLLSFRMAATGAHGPITSPKGVPSAHPSTKLAELVTEQLRTHMSFTQ